MAGIVANIAKVLVVHRARGVARGVVAKPSGRLVTFASAPGMGGTGRRDMVMAVAARGRGRLLSWLLLLSFVFENGKQGRGGAFA